MTLGNLPISYDQLTPVQVIEWRNNMNEINSRIKKKLLFYQNAAQNHCRCQYHNAHTNGWSAAAVRQKQVNGGSN